MQAYAGAARAGERWSFFVKRDEFIEPSTKARILFIIDLAFSALLISPQIPRSQKTSGYPMTYSHGLAFVFEYFHTSRANRFRADL